MKISGTRFTIITILILLIPIYGNWKLLLFGQKTKGTVIKTIEENNGMIVSYFSAIEFTAIDQKKYIIKGPENLEYEIGKVFPILYRPESPKDAVIFSVKGIYLNRLTSVSLIIFLFWMAFYLSFSPKSSKRQSGKQKNSSRSYIRRKRLN